jgi:glutathione S-transferase
VKLYTTRRAPNPRRVAWVMAEKGITDIEVIEIDLLKGEHRTPEYLGKVGVPNSPALELDDGVVITESVAIGRYLESRYPEPNLYGRDPEEIAVVEMWTRRAELTVSMPLMGFVRHTHPAMAALAGEQSAEYATVSRSFGESGLKAFDRRLAASAFLAGDRLTIADIVAFSGVDFGRLVQYRPPEKFTHVARWIDDLRARPTSTAGL